MLLRRATPLALAMLALACEPSVPFDARNNPAAVDYAAFDPTGSPPSLPLPNDLALSESSVSTQNPAQAALLTQWQVEGFPNDQEVPITIDFVRETVDPATGKATRRAPQLDTSTVTPATLLLLAVGSSGSGPVAYDAPAPSDYAANGDHGTLTLHKSKDSTGSRRWPPGVEMVVAVRGGPNGVKVKDGAPGGLQPQPAMFLLLQDKDLTLPENGGLLPGNSRGEKAAAAAQLESIRKTWLAPFAAIDASGAFDHREIATLATFRVASTSRRTHVETDPGSGRMPLPSDLLLGPDGRLAPELASPTGPFGALGPGLATLDGFSTTAMILMQTSAAIDASTVNANSVFLYEIGKAGLATRLGELQEPGKTPRFVAEPPQITRPVNGVPASTVIGLQPAVPAQLPAGAVLSLPPLGEGTTYVVLVSDRVKDLNGDKLVRSTLGKILLLDPSISLFANGKSQVSGVSDGQAAGIDRMREAVNLAVASLLAEKRASGLQRDDLVMAYTFTTQTMKSVATALAALPYQDPAAALTDTARKTFCGARACDAPIADVFAAYGLSAAPGGNVFAVVDTTITTFDKLTCPAGASNCLDTGAFTPQEVPPVPEPVRMLLALPAPPYEGCTPGKTAPLCTVPLAVFRHGFGSWRGSMLAVADVLNAHGIAVAAIDAARHGDRSFCSADAQCAGGACVPVAALAGEGDAVPPGKCATDFLRAGGAPSGNPAASGNFLITGNLFRTRDTLRQDVIDQSQLVRVLSPNPRCHPDAAPADAANTCANGIVSGLFGVQFDPARIWFVGQSLGAISGTLDVAANPRMARAALNVGGATIADVFTQSPSFQAQLGALLSNLGIAPGSAAFLQFVQVAKWVLDPADPENFAENLARKTLPSPLLGGAAPPPRPVLGQMALCDQVVPNAFSLNLYGEAGLPTTGGANSAAASFTTFAAGPGAACPGNAVDHAFLLASPAAQSDIADFFLGTPPPPLRAP
ncbi:MAG TPA: hypothetical protein VI356_04150 [Myxococcales bacterium]